MNAERPPAAPGAHAPSDSPTRAAGQGDAAAATPTPRADAVLARILRADTLPALPEDFAARSAHLVALRVAAERRLQRRFRATLVGVFVLVCGAGLLLAAGLPGLGSFAAEGVATTGQDWLLLVGALLALQLVVLRGR